MNDAAHPISTQVSDEAARPCLHEKGKRYQPTPIRTALVTIALAGQLLLGLIVLLLTCQFAASVPAVEPRALANLLRHVRLLRLGEALAGLAGAIAFVAWLYRTYCNSRGLGIVRLGWHPGWIIWCLIIQSLAMPVLNRCCPPYFAVGLSLVIIPTLFVPYFMMQEAWRSSNPHVESIHQLQRGVGRNSMIVRCWWIWQLLGTMIFGMAPILVSPLSTLRERLLWCAVILFAIKALDAGLTLTLVRGLNRRQAQRCEVYCRLRAQEPSWELPSR